MTILDFGFETNMTAPFRRDDPSDPRLGELITRLSGADLWPEKADWIIAGYPDDEGILRGGGRAGAAEGPQRIRFWLERMTPALNRSRTAWPAIFDVGNLSRKDADLAERHERARRAVAQCLKRGQRWLALGGGHDYGYSDGMGFCDWAKTEAISPVILHFDAHLDVRDPTRGLSSGTPFHRLLTAVPEAKIFAIGIQSQCNSSAHLNWLRDRGGQVLFLDEILLSPEPAANVVLRFLEEPLTERSQVFLSLDLDVFALPWAPGCSQSWPTGLDVNGFWPVLESLLSRLDVRVAGLYETAPALDVADATSKLAAQLAQKILFSVGPA